ncbi:MAG: ABC transporter substrate-binding protein [Actinomycetota bacterium]|nr:ABC transporter substrate-binding protein [Actinomycetota bacterium]
MPSFLLRKKRLARRGRLAGVLIGASLVLASCSSGSSSSGSSTASSTASTSAPAVKIKDGGQIIVGLPAAPEALDPATEATYYGRIVFANMCLGLYGISASGLPTPVLASAAPTISDGGLTYTIPLKSGVKFNDGTSFDAAAVVTSLTRDQTLPTSARASALKDITSITATGNDTVQLKLAAPDSALTTILAGRSGIVISPTALTKEGANFGQQPVCVGPFMFSSRPSLDQINLVKSPYFYDAASVHASSLEFTVITDPSTCYSNLLSGAINVAACLAPNDVALLKSNSQYQTQSVITNAYSGLDINVGNANGYNKPSSPPNNPFAQHPALMKAFELSISRKTINNVVFGGINLPGCTPLAPSSPYHTAIGCTHRNIAEAKSIIASTGVATPIPVTLMVPTGTLNTQEGEVIASEASQAGFNVTVQSTEFTTALAAAESGNYEMFAIGWSGRVDPDQNITPFYAPGSALNYTGVQDPTLQSLLTQGRTATTVSARKAIYAQVEQRLAKDLGIIYLYHEAFQLANVSTLKGVDFTPDGIIHFQNAGFTA